MKILITGAAGWLARALTDVLADQGHELVLLDRVEPSTATIFVPGQQERKAAPLITSLPYVKADLDDVPALSRAAQGVEAIVHLAAATTGLWPHGEAIMNANVQGSFNVFTAARDSGVRRVVQASSINAFGTFAWRTTGRHPVYARLPLVEDAPAEPEDPYSLSKWCAEQVAATFHRAFAMEAVSLRFAGVWTREAYETRCSNGMPATAAWADDLFQWVHVDDVIAGIVLAIFGDYALPDPITLAAEDTKAPEPTMQLINRFRPDLLASLREPLPGRRTLLSITRAQAFLGYQPRFRIDPPPSGAGH